jgi:hypothetical protein
MGAPSQPGGSQVTVDSPGDLREVAPVPGALQFTPVQFTPIQFQPVDLDQSLPLESSRNGNVFNDRFNAQLSWYLPGFELAPDPDASFAFAAGGGQTGADGNPYYEASLTLTLAKVEPADVTAYRTANPSQQLQEIPLTAISVELTTTANDPQTGQPEQSIYTATATNEADGNLTLTFGPIVGTHVLVAYSNLQNGGATLGLSAQFRVWRALRVFRPVWPPIRVPVDPVRQPGQPIIPGRPRPLPQAMLAPVGTPIFDPGRGPIRLPPRPLPPRPLPPQPEPTYTIAVDPYTQPFDLSTKYAAPVYARSYTIKDSNGIRSIVSINDLKNFNSSGTDFTEFTALGDIQQRFPTFSRLYIGGQSRKVIAVPTAYGIVRGKNGTAAQCQALLDSTAGGGGAAKFQFSFVLGPVISPFDFFALQAALATNPQSQNCTLALPQRLDTTQPMMVSTPFQSSVTYTAGLQPNLFQLDVAITDGSVTGSAVANANLFIKQLSTTVAPYLSGSFGIVLDDAYPHPVTASVVVNLNETSGSDEISYSVTADGSVIQLLNVSPLDLQVSQYAIINGTSAPAKSLNQKIPAQQGFTLSDKPSSSAVSLLVDRTLALESPFTKDALQRYVTFSTQDVQTVNYQLGVVANGVNFAAMGIAEIDIAITIPSLPTVTVPSSKLMPLSLASNTVINLPIQNAITSLSAVIAFTVKPVDTTKASVPFTVMNDFVEQPVYVLESSSIPPFPA